MNEHDLRDQVRRYLDGFGPYDRRHTAELFSQLPPRRARTHTLLAAVAAGLLVAGVVAALLLPGLLRAARESGPPRPVPASRPTPTPSPAPPTLLVLGSDHRGLVRMDWSGHVLGSTQLSGGGHPAPDGSMLLSVPLGGGAGLLISGTDGHVIDTVPSLGYGLNGAGPMWADDSRHICGLHSSGAGRELAIASVDPVRGTTGLRTLAVPDIGAGPAAFVDACSFRTDRVVISRFDGGRDPAGTVLVLRLSDGSTLLRRDYPAPAPFVNVWAASDGLFLVGAGYEDPITSSVVIDLTTGQQVARLAGAGFAFTADDRYVAVSSVAGERGAPGGTGSLVDWRTGRVVWQGPGELSVLASRPDADAIAVVLTTSDAHGISSQRELIVAPDAPAIPIDA